MDRITSIRGMHGCRLRHSQRPNTIWLVNTYLEVYKVTNIVNNGIFTHVDTLFCTYASFGHRRYSTRTYSVTYSLGWECHAMMKSVGGWIPTTSAMRCCVSWAWVFTAACDFYFYICVIVDVVSTADVIWWICFHWDAPLVGRG